MLFHIRHFLYDGFTFTIFIGNLLRSISCIFSYSMENISFYYIWLAALKANSLFLWIALLSQTKNFFFLLFCFISRSHAGKFSIDLQSFGLLFVLSMFFFRSICLLHFRILPLCHICLMGSMLRVLLLFLFFFHFSPGCFDHLFAKCIFILDVEEKKIVTSRP